MKLLYKGLNLNLVNARVQPTPDLPQPISESFGQHTRGLDARWFRQSARAQRNSLQGLPEHRTDHAHCAGVGIAVMAQPLLAHVGVLV